MFNLRHKLLATAALALIAAPAYAQQQPLDAVEDDTPITLSGTVATVEEGEFTMNYGDGTVTVKMENWDWFGRADSPLTVGDEVVVTGEIDDDLFSGSEINAETVYLVTDNAYYYTEEADSVPAYQFYSYRTTEPATPPGGATGATAAAEPTPPQSWVSAVGTVQSIQGDEFTLDAGRYNLVVDAERMMGMPEVAVGEKVYVAGLLNQNFFSNREITADRVVTLSASAPRTEGTMPGQPAPMGDTPAN